MVFEQVCEHIDNCIKANALPDERAHKILAPFNRVNREEALLSNPNPKLSAVLILIYPDYSGAPQTVLMKRNAYKGVHSKQISFPGGKREAHDPSFEHTALREAEEEVNVSRNMIQILGRLSDVYIPPSGFLVKPIVGIATRQPHFLPDAREVETIIETPLSIITAPHAIKQKQVALSESNARVTVPYFDVYGHTVWGATAMMLGELRAILSDFNK